MRVLPEYIVSTSTRVACVYGLDPGRKRPRHIKSASATAALHMTDATAVSALPEHLNDLRLIAQAEATAGIAARDVVVSIENALKNALDDQVAGAASLLSLFARRSAEEVRRIAVLFALTGVTCF